MVRAIDGRYGFRPDGDGTLVTYDLSIDLAVPLPGLVKRRAAGLITNAALQDLRRAAEGGRAVTSRTPRRCRLRRGGRPRSGRCRLPSTLEVVLTELLGAVPEVRDALLAAADSLLDAARALIDAADRVRVSAARRARGRPPRPGSDHERPVGVRRGPRRHQPAGRARRSRRDRRRADARSRRRPRSTASSTAIADAVAELQPLRSDARALGVGAAGMVDREGVIHYSPNVPAFLEAPVRAAAAGRARHAGGASTTTPTSRRSGSSSTARRGGVPQCARDHAGHRRGRRVVVRDGRVLRGAHGFGGEIGHFQVDPTRADVRVRRAWSLGGARRPGTALGSLGPQRVADGRPRRRCSSGRAAIAVAVEGTHVGDAALAGAPDALAIVREYARAGRHRSDRSGEHPRLRAGRRLGWAGRARRRCCSIPIREVFVGHLEGARHRPEVPVVAAELGDRMPGWSGAAALARCRNGRRLRARTENGPVTGLGITLPSFRTTVEPALRRRARGGGGRASTACFAYDHLFRQGGRRHAGGRRSRCSPCSGRSRRRP